MGCLCCKPRGENEEEREPLLEGATVNVISYTTSTVVVYYDSVISCLFPGHAGSVALVVKTS